MHVLGCAIKEKVKTEEKMAKSNGYIIDCNAFILVTSSLGGFFKVKL